MIIREMGPEDWPDVAKIYAEGIATGHATFEKEVPGWQSWDASHIKTCRLVVEIHGRLAAWAALSPVSSRCIYAGVAESSIYIAEAFRGKKVGEALLNALIAESEKQGFWTLQAGVFPENTASTQLHLKCGYRLVGIREKIGLMNGVWRNNQLLERRSKIVGTTTM